MMCHWSWYCDQGAGALFKVILTTVIPQLISQWKQNHNANGHIHVQLTFETAIFMSMWIENWSIRQASIVLYELEMPAWSADQYSYKLQMTSHQCWNIFIDANIVLQCLSNIPSWCAKINSSTFMSSQISLDILLLLYLSSIGASHELRFPSVESFQLKVTYYLSMLFILQVTCTASSAVQLRNK